ncbi:unnamed protein product [Schistocephalus solidus]|uniref:Fibronectin type-III domain-containing protein n=1 Tax=Schistocephalus solidus TaxID=70667 RepID=A0A183TBW3_SCHSO|nr:unnamed protein product [Schistocephalus solidus]
MKVLSLDYFEIRNIKVEAESATAIRLSWDAPFQEDVKILAFVINLQFNRTDISMANGDHYVAATEIPSAPFNVTAVAFNATAVHICWQPPHNIGRKLDYYKMVLQYKGDFSSYQSINVKTGPFKNCWVVDDLPSETEIAVTIAAVVREKEQGAMSNEGTWSDAVHVTTLPADVVVMTRSRLFGEESIHGRRGEISLLDVPANSPVLSTKNQDFTQKEKGSSSLDGIEQECLGGHDKSHPDS